MTGTYATSTLGPDRPRTATRPAVLRGPLLALLAVFAVLALASPSSAAQTPGPAAEDDSVTPHDVIRGGDQLFNGSARCTVAFNATDGSNYYGIMPGYCGTVGDQWHADPDLTTPVGVTHMSHFPGQAWSVIRYTNDALDYPSEIHGQTGPSYISGADEPRLGQTVCSVGATTGHRCGTITDVNVSLQLPEGIFTGLFQADLCAEPGDGGAYAGDRAVGVLAGGSGNCAGGGTSYYQPIPPILAATGLTIGY